MIRRRVAGWCWIVVGLLGLADLVAAIGWVGLYSDDGFEPWRITISDLGATGCAVPDSGYDNCSPLFPVVALTLIMTGLLIILGALLVIDEGGPRRTELGARGLLVVAGLLVAVQGIVPPWNAYGPEPIALVTGTTLAAAALIMLGVGLRRRRVLVLGLIGLTAGVVFLGLVSTGPPRVLGRVGGLLERLSVYPVLVGLILLGVRRVVTTAGKSLAPAAPAA